ncbi:MAG: HEPN domain-containing protein [Gammaproteobacteria bacterium]|nr:HEPN domain-containing protein [Gammaproteobacteria bacterium]
MTPEQHLEAAKKRLRAAAVLLENGLSGEAGGRAYYAIYSAIRAALVARSVPEGRRHQGNHRLFYEHIVHKGLVGENIARVVGRAHFIRLRSDYSDEETNDGDARALLVQAQEFVETIEKVILRRT